MLKDSCPAGLANIVSFCQTHAGSQAPFSFFVDADLAGSDITDYFGSSSVTVIAKFASTNNGWIQAYSTSNNHLSAVASVTGGATYGWYKMEDYLPLNGGTMVGDITMNSNSDIYLSSSGSKIYQQLVDTSNYGAIVQWQNDTLWTNTYKPHIGIHNINNRIVILPYSTDT